MIPEQAGSVVHHDAWCRFCREWRQRNVSDERVPEAWAWFLHGWLAKAKQADELRGRR